MEIAIKQAYQMFVRKLWGRDTFVYEEEPKDEICIRNFIKTLIKEYGEESIGKNFIYDYFCFQTNYWINLNTRFGKRIPVSWFLGKKAFERWKNNPEPDLYHAHQTANQLGIHIGLIYGEKKSLIKALVLNTAEENEKNRFYNTDRGFLNCIESTTLYSHLSKACITCKFKNDCKELLRANFYKIWLKRGYSEKNAIEERKRA